MSETDITEKLLELKSPVGLEAAREIIRLSAELRSANRKIVQMKDQLKSWREDDEAFRLRAENENLRTAILKADCYLGLNAPSLARDALGVVFGAKSEGEKG